jgi:hypothetical protein
LGVALAGATEETAGGGGVALGAALLAVGVESVLLQATTGAAQARPTRRRRRLFMVTASDTPPVRPARVRRCRRRSRHPASALAGERIGRPCSGSAAFFVNTHLVASSVFH